ncbi:MAG: phosphate ABC transporter ATP-binding protein [Caldilineae bacterium]|nr:MAG: phosphate ABC transporter ATP-binding protein [Caldilineae bacterium]
MNSLPPILRTEHLTRIVQGKTLVDHISVTVERGDVLAVIGPSGAGKSSFLRLLNRLDEPTEGAVYLEGRDYRTIPPRELRRRVGMLMQAPFLFPGTVADNIRFGPLQRDELLPDAAIQALLERVHLPGYATRRVDNLSGGEAQRVSLARTLANRPDILLLDEPTSALDDATERDVEALVAEIIRDQALTCLLVTHKMEQAQRLANRAMLMEAGRLVAVGPIEEVLHAHPAL